MPLRKKEELSAQTIAPYHCLRGKNIPLFVKNNFGNFYSNLFQHQWNGEGRSVAMLNMRGCKSQELREMRPCVAYCPSTQDLYRRESGGLTVIGMIIMMCKITKNTQAMLFHPFACAL